jgi:predicted AlkP superfamily pyrophosphatase or phosphodiesterase
MYPADGRKLPDIWASPSSLRDELNAKLGTFPLFNFWGPRADISSSHWIARSAEHVYVTRRPTLTLVYLPHLDYCLQKLGPTHPAIADHLREIDGVAGELIDRVERDGTRVLVVSEYGIVAVNDAIHINRALRQAGLIQVRTELGRELLDAGLSDAFAVADHQIAHVYVQNPARIEEVRALVGQLDGVDQVLHDKSAIGLDHARSGELVAIAKPNRWFSYYYWTDDDRAPDFARCVDIHRKPGYDPVELFLDPTMRVPMAQVAFKLARSKLGFRTLLNVIPLDTTLVRGSHGRPTDEPGAGPLVISSEANLLGEDLHATDFKQTVLSHVFD